MYELSPDAGGFFGVPSPGKYTSEKKCTERCGYGCCRSPYAGSISTDEITKGAIFRGSARVNVRAGHNFGDSGAVSSEEIRCFWNKLVEQEPEPTCRLVKLAIFGLGLSPCCQSRANGKELCRRGCAPQ
ncbi:uncharacterized protein FFMR_15897 [Fusarium fujikuroi]|nr:uncharacterized protein FFMR_15897 [Fusarium fujikuroi]